MAILTAKQIKEMKKEEKEKKLKELKVELIKVRASQSAAKSKEIKKAIARLLTLK